MRTTSILACAVLAAAAAWSEDSPAAAPDEQAAAVPAPTKPAKIILVGDSTVAVQGGWGSSFCAGHVTESVACVNLARGGRSSASYIAEGLWENALAEARTPGYGGTWVLIQFGHNDQPGKPGRSTDLATGFPVNLARYVREARAAGAKPVLVTPLTRRMFKKGTLRNELRPWADAIVRVARDLDVPLVDLNALSSVAVQGMGAAEAAKFAPARPTNEVLAAAAEGTTIAAATGVDDRPAPAGVPGMARPEISFDYTHLGREGADYFSAMVAAELARVVPELRPMLIP